MKKIIFLLISAALLFVACDDDDVFSLEGTWTGSSIGGTSTDYWVFDDDSLNVTLNSLSAVALYETNTDTLPYTMKITFLSNPNTTAHLEGRQYWGIYEYDEDDEKLSIGFKLPLGLYEYPDNFNDTVHMKIWELYED